MQHQWQFFGGLFFKNEKTFKSVENSTEREANVSLPLSVKEKVKF